MAVMSRPCLASDPELIELESKTEYIGPWLAEKEGGC
uniref:Uncharacterized protein n=1 Tax=Trichinella nativa TaxID=6335 RepID=A0A0V1K722_9BILA